MASALAEIHALLVREGGYAPIIRLAVARYDERTGIIHALGYSGARVDSLDSLACDLGDVPSLAILASGHEPRILDDLESGPKGPLTRQLLAAGCRSSLTLPIWRGDRFLGFVFVDASLPGYFDAGRVARLREVAGAVSLVLG